MPPSSTTSRHDVAHLLRRTGFGGTEAELVALTGRTRAECVDAVMGFRAGDPVPAGPDVGVPGFVSRDEQWQSHARVLDWWYDRMAALTAPTSVPTPAPAVAAPCPLQEKMVLFWHDHFACGQDKIYDIPALWDQMRMFRRMWLDPFEDVLRAVSVHPAMLVYLDNESNVKGAEQENFARELMELYTCGVDHFTEPDVVSMARAWTGHNTVGWNGSYWDSTYVYRPERHDSGAKRLFGITANWNGIARAAGERDTITELVHGVRRTATSRFLARKLFRWFAHLDPSDAVVDDLAATFRASGMSTAALVRAILLHEEFWGGISRYAQIKSPTEYVVWIMKRTGVPAGDLGLRWRMESLGQVLLEPPSVAGWGTGTSWMSTASAWGRGGMMSNLRWTMGDRGFLSGLADLSSPAAAQAVLDAFGIEQVSGATRAELERWHARTVSSGETRWSTSVQGFLVGSLLPEVQVQ